jgi:hypothetical protein
VYGSVVLNICFAPFLGAVAMLSVARKRRRYRGRLQRRGATAGRAALCLPQDGWICSGFQAPPCRSRHRASANAKLTSLVGKARPTTTKLQLSRHSSTDACSAVHHCPSTVPTDLSRSALPAAPYRHAHGAPSPRTYAPPREAVSHLWVGCCCLHSSAASTCACLPRPRVPLPQTRLAAITAS